MSVGAIYKVEGADGVSSSGHRCENSKIVVGRSVAGGKGPQAREKPGGIKAPQQSPPREEVLEVFVLQPKPALLNHCGLVWVV